MVTCLSAPLLYYSTPWKISDRCVPHITLRSPRRALQLSMFTDRWRRHHQSRLEIPSSLSTRSAALEEDSSKEFDDNRVPEDASPTTTDIRNDEGEDASMVQLLVTEPSLHLDYVSPEAVTAVIHQVEHDVVLSKQKNKRAKLGRFTAPNVELLLGLGLTEAQVVKVMGWNPSILGYDTDTKLWPFLDLLFSYGIDQSHILKCLSGRWMAFSRDLDDVRGVIDYLILDLGVSKLGKIVASSPALLGYSYETLKSTQRTLETVGIVDVGALVERDPQVLTCSPKKLTENVQFLRRLMSLEDVAPIILKTPKVMWADAKTMEISAEKYILRWGEKKAFKLFEKYPNALTGAWGPKEEKLDYVEQVMGRTFDDILMCPSIMTYNLENRIKYRYKMLQRVGRENIKLGSFLSIKESVFTSRYMG